jgi:hypothetical protein
MGGEHREAALEVLAVARGTFGLDVASHERLEFVVAVLTGVFEERHTPRS